MFFSESNQPEVNRRHAGMTDERHSFVRCFETWLFALNGFGREVQDMDWTQCICTGHVGL